MSLTIGRSLSAQGFFLYLIISHFFSSDFLFSLFRHTTIVQHGIFQTSRLANLFIFPEISSPRGLSQWATAEWRSLHSACPYLITLLLREINQGTKYNKTSLVKRDSDVFCGRVSQH
jgi:hypothetical protein